MPETIPIEGRVVGAEMLPYVIAEMSANHNSHIGTAFKIIEAAKKAGGRCRQAANLSS